MKSIETPSCAKHFKYPSSMASGDAKHHLGIEHRVKLKTAVLTRLRSI